MPRALLSVSDKTALADFARALAGLDWTLIASGGTARSLREAGLAVIDITDLTGMPEMLGGRVKTLHPAIHAGILARPTQTDLAELATHDMKPIDLVVCNLYPFEKAVAKPDVSLGEAVEEIDIGGAALLRSAAKNFSRVTVVCDPGDYEWVIDELRARGTVSAEIRHRLAVKSFAHTRDYDATIEAYLRQAQPTGPNCLLQRFNISWPLLQELRYGENPHQVAGLYSQRADGPLGGSLLQGQPLSYNNLLDLSAAWSTALAFDDPTIVIVKHLSPCGIASAERLADAFPAALSSDPVSAFGGVVAANRTIDYGTAHDMRELFVEAVVAPAFDSGALGFFAQHKPNCRLVAVREPIQDTWEFRSVVGGMLAQSVDRGDPPNVEWNVVSLRRPTDEEMVALRFAWKACSHVKSNAIVLARDKATVGIGGGLPSRVDAVKLAVTKAGENAHGAVMASDAFFPFPDGVEVAANAGVTAVVQPGGSIRDEAVIAAANRSNLAMLFTGTRHFRH